MFEKIRNRLDFRGAVLDLLKYDGLDFFTDRRWWSTNGIDRKLVSYIHSGELESTAKGWMFNYDPRRAAIDHVDQVYRAYRRLTGIAPVPDDFIRIMDNITRYRSIEVAQFWKSEIIRFNEQVAKEHAEQKLRLPQILEARRAAKDFFAEGIDAILDGDIAFEAEEIWESISSSPKSEWEVHQSTGISIQEVCKWVLIFYSVGLISSESNAMPEAVYDESFFPPASDEHLAIYDAFKEHVEFL